MSRRSRIVLIAIGITATITSCTERLLYIKSDPPDATIIINGKEAGKTPYKQEFTFYGTLEIILAKDGYNSAKLIKDVGVPWYQYPILDFITDVLIPLKIKDVTKINIKLEKTQPRTSANSNNK